MTQTREREFPLNKNLNVHLKMEGPLNNHHIKLSSEKKLKRSKKNLSYSIKKAEAAFIEREKR